MVTLRWYQEEAINAIYNYYSAGNNGHALLALPTGTGKSLIIGELIRRVLAEWPNQRFIILTHVKELISQDIKALLSVWPTAPYGIYSAGLGRKDTIHNVIFGGIASVYRSAELFGHRDLVIVDEAHLINFKSDTMYQKTFNILEAINPYMKVIGLTATWYRLGQGLLTDGGLFNDIIYNVCNSDGFGRLLADNYLSPVIPKQTQVELNTDGVMINGGEFVLEQLQQAVNVPAITRAALTEVVHYGQDRKSWLIFCSGIDHAKDCADVLNAMGIPCRAVHSKIKDAERDEILTDFRSGHLRAVTNNNVLTTGFDHPQIDLIAMLRPTMSPGLWVQMLGRGTRPAPSKHNCLVLDFARNTQRLGPIDDPRIPGRPGPSTGEVPIKICPACGAYNHLRVTHCVLCGQEFTFQQKLIKSADTAPLMSFNQPIVETIDVWNIIYSKHIGKNSGRASVCVNYYTPRGPFREYLSFDADGYPRHVAHEWWKKHMTSEPPMNSDMALLAIAQSRRPKKIRVWTNNKYPKVLSHEF